MPVDKNAAWPEAAELAASPAFDENFYLQYSGIPSERTSQSSARHFLIWGWKQGFPLHPLIELEYIDKGVLERQRRGEWGAVLSWLYSAEARTRPWGALFDPRALGGAAPLDVLASLRDDSPVPVPPEFVGEPPTLGAVRAAILDWVQRYRKEFTPALPVRRATWDADETSSWVESLAPVPAAAKVSVIMPVRDREDTIGDAIDSVLAQTHRNFELIVVDDGSIDSTQDRVAAYASHDPRVQLIAGSRKGVGPARQTGLEVATGEFVAFLDSDNTWTERFLEHSVAALSADDQVVATHAGLRLHGDNGSVQYRGGDVAASDLQLGNSIDINVLVTRSRVVRNVGGFDPQLRRWVDYDLVLRLAKVGELRYLPFIGCDYANQTRSDRITNRESLHWEWVVKEKNLVDWAAAGGKARVEGRVSVVLLVTHSSIGPRRLADQILTESPRDLEIILIDCGARPAVGQSLIARYAAEPRVRYVRLAANPQFSAAANFGFEQSTGQQVVFVNSDATPRDGWLEAMLREKAESGALAVQALVTQRNGAVYAAGYAFLGQGAVPTPLLADLTLTDAREADIGRLSAISRQALLVDATSFATLRGFDPLFVEGYEDVDFCLRARREFGPEAAHFRCVTDAVLAIDSRSDAAEDARQSENRRIFVERWSSTDLPDDSRIYESRSLRVTDIVPGQGVAKPYYTPFLVREPRERSADPGATASPLRWALKIGATNTQDRWGDVPFADDLAKALRERGQDAVVDRYGAHDRLTGYLDDVVLTIRGRHAIPPRPGAVNVMWVISRPDLITVDEVRAYDLVYSASPKWAAWMGAQAGRRIDVLHQATDPDRFRPDLADFEQADDVLFVGAPRAAESPRYGRRLIGHAIEAEAPLGVWGPGWEKFVPANRVRGDFLDFAHTPRAYRSARIALNDHWADMREWGFISNRAFDIIACGTPVISDEIAGLEIFQGAAVVADSAARMRELVTDRSWIPSSERMMEISEMVRAEHSFAARADALIRAVRDFRNSAF